MKSWFCRLPDGVAGPLSMEELRFLRDRGRLKPHHMVSVARDGPWRPASKLNALFETGTSRTALPAAAVVDSGVVEVADEPQEPSESSHVPDLRRPAFDQHSDLSTSTDNRGEIRSRVLIGGATGAAIVLLVLLLFLLLRGVAGNLAMSNRRAANGEGGQAAQRQGDGTDESTGEAASDRSGGQYKDRSPSDDEVAHASPDNTAESDNEDESTDPDAAATGDGDSSAAPDYLISIAREEPASAADRESAGRAGGGRGQTGGRRGDGGEFFGLKAKGREFVYVVDSSSSMSGDRFKKATDELVSSLSKLKRNQSFFVIFFSNDSYPMYYPNPPESKMVRASKDNVAECENWIRDFVVSGGTEPTGAMLFALNLKPDAIFLLTDGSFDAGVVDQISNNNKSEVIVNTIGFVQRSGEALLVRIAEENRGDYKFVP